MSEELKWEIEFSLNPFNFAPSPLRRLFVIFGKKKKNCSRRKISLTLGSLCRQPGRLLPLLSLRSLPDLLEGRTEGEGSTTGNNLWVHLCSSSPSAHPPGGDWSPHGGQSLGALARRPCPS